MERVEEEVRVEVRAERGQLSRRPGRLGLCLRRFGLRACRLGAIERRFGLAEFSSAGGGVEPRSVGVGRGDDAVVEEAAEDDAPPPPAVELGRADLSGALGEQARRPARGAGPEKAVGGPERDVNGDERHRVAPPAGPADDVRDETRPVAEDRGREHVAEGDGRRLERGRPAEQLRGEKEPEHGDPGREVERDGAARRDPDRRQGWRHGERPSGDVKIGSGVAAARAVRRAVDGVARRSRRGRCAPILWGSPRPVR